MQPPLRRLRAGAVLCHAAALFCAGTETCRNDVYCPSSCTVLQAVVDTISKYLPGNRAGMNATSFALLKVQTGGGAGAWVSGLFGGCLAAVWLPLQGGALQPAWQPRCAAWALLPLPSGALANAPSLPLNNNVISCLFFVLHSLFPLHRTVAGFTNAELFRKYLWYFLRERQFDEVAVGDLVALKAALGLDDAAVAGALAERARRIYEQYGTVMVNLEGMSQVGAGRGGVQVEGGSMREGWLSGSCWGHMGCRAMGRGRRCGSCLGCCLEPPRLWGGLQA